MKITYLLLALCISLISFAQKKATTNIENNEIAAKWKNIPAKKSTTKNPDDGYPSVKIVTPGTKIPTIGELRRKTLDLLSSHPVHTSKRVTNFSNFSNTGTEAWDCEMWQQSKEKPAYDEVLSFHFYIGEDYYSGKVSQRIALVGKKLVHKKTGKVMKQ
jgi:hypothetical protein